MPRKKKIKDVFYAVFLSTTAITATTMREYHLLFSLCFCHNAENINLVNVLCNKTFPSGVPCIYKQK